MEVFSVHINTSDVVLSGPIVYRRGVPDVVFLTWQPTIGN